MKYISVISNIPIIAILQNMLYTNSIEWDVFFTRRAAKQAGQLGDNIMLILQVLVEDLKRKGPAPGAGWSNYGKLRGRKNEDKRHCHLLKGNPTYVCCWSVCKISRSMEIYYVGTHEKAPY